jgi:hypothetical protein
VSIQVQICLSRFIFRRTPLNRTEGDDKDE